MTTTALEFCLTSYMNFPATPDPGWFYKKHALKTAIAGLEAGPMLFLSHN